MHTRALAATDALTGQDFSFSWPRINLLFIFALRQSERWTGAAATRASGGKDGLLA